MLFAWLWFAMEFIAAITGKNPIAVEVILLTPWLTVLALILASAWKGFARVEAMGACILMLIGYHFYFYV